MIVPARTAWMALVAGLVPAALPLVVGAGVWPVWGAYVLGVAVFALIDLALDARPGDLELVLELPRQVEVGRGATARLRVALRGSRDRELELAAELDPHLDLDLPARVTAGRQPRVLEIGVTGRRRGSWDCRALRARWTTRAGTFTRTVRVVQDARLDVVPDLEPVRAAAFRLRDDPRHLAGLKTDRWRGSGSELDSLREFVPGDDERLIDWKATARHHHLLRRQMRAESNHQVAIVFDTGRTMSETVADVPRLDLAIGAGLLLAWSALKTGDRVSLHAFDERIRLDTSPQAGAAAFDRLRLATARLAYGDGETNFTLGLTELATRLRRRSLIVLFTEIADPVSAELMIANCARIATRHVLLFVTLKHVALERTATAVPMIARDVARAAAASDLLHERRGVLTRLRRLGVTCIEARADELGPALVARYVDLSRRERVG